MDGTFPRSENIFRLVSIAKDGKSVQIGIVGGSFDSGQPTATLKVGGKLTLVNTADGTRYVIGLKSKCARGRAGNRARRRAPPRCDAGAAYGPADRDHDRDNHHHADRHRRARHRHPDALDAMASYAYTAINAEGLELRGEVQAPTRDGRPRGAPRAGPPRRAAHRAARTALRGAPARGSRPRRRHGLRGEGVKTRSLQVFSRPVRDDDRRRSERRHVARHLEDQTDDSSSQGDRRGARGRRARRAPVRGARPPPEGVLPDLHLDGRGGRGGRHPGRGPRPARHPDREGGEPEAPREGRDGLPDRSSSRSRSSSCAAMLLFIVPIFEKLYNQLGGHLPMLTQYIVKASDIMRSDWYIVFPTIGFTIFGSSSGRRARAAASSWDRFKLRVPMKIGDIVLKVTMARFGRTLSTLVAAGVDIIKALEITGTTAGNWVVEEALRGMREQVHAGVPIAQPLIEHPVFPPMVGQMVKIGEETGELDAMLGKIADFYEEEVDASIASLTSIIEPIMIIIVGAMVGTIILSMYLPMFKLLTLIK